MTTLPEFRAPGISGPGSLGRLHPLEDASGATQNPRRFSTPQSCMQRPVNSHPLSKQVALMVKTFLPQDESAEWQWLQLRAAEDPRIHLYGCCDVFLSLHRSEGFGRGMAEALQLGVDVIATDYGGNTDFCIGPLAHPVRRWPPAGGAGSRPCR